MLIVLISFSLCIYVYGDTHIFMLIHPWWDEIVHLSDKKEINKRLIVGKKIIVSFQSVEKGQCSVSLQRTIALLIERQPCLSMALLCPWSTDEL